MELSLNVGYFGPHIANNHEYIKELDDIGISCIWTAEAYGYDAVTPLSYFAGITSNLELGAGIMQIPGRTPAMTAMTAVTIDKLSNGRFRLGLGVSGPQVVEGWHGVQYGKPLLKTREYIKIIRDILNRDEKVTFEGTYYNLPFNGEDATGLGKPLKLIEEPYRKNIPIYLAAIGPKNIELSAEITDGWLPFMYSPSKGDEIFNKYLKVGFDKSQIKDKKKNFEIVATTYAKLCKPEEKETYLQPARQTFALYIGGMGAQAGATEFTESVSKSLVSTTLKGCTIEKTEVFKERVFVMVVYDANKAREEAKAVARAEAKKEEALYSEFKARQAFDALDQALDRMKGSSSVSAPE